MEWSRPDVQEFEDLIGETTARLRKKSATNKLDVFMEARQSFRRLQSLRDPPRLNVSPLESEILAAEKVENFIRDAQIALRAGEYRRVGEKAAAAMQGMREAAWLGIDAETLRPIQATQQILVTAASLSAVSREIFATEIEPKLATLVANPDQTEAIFRSLPNDEIKHAVSACLNLRNKKIAGEDEDFQIWAQRILAEEPSRLGAHLAKFRGAIDAKLIGRRGEKAQREHHHKLAMERWRQNSKDARDSFHLAAERAVELQWELGPTLLVALEQICRQRGLWARSIPWDPARMVGWKIMASQVRLDARDLQVAAQELAPSAIGISLTNGPTTTVADGSSFTDYVHYVAISKPGFRLAPSHAICSLDLFALKK